MGVSFAQRLAALPPAEQGEMYAVMSDADIEALERDWRFWARPEQLPPPGVWWLWMILTGRGWGKGRSGSEWVIDRSEEFHRRKVRKHRVGLIGRTAADCRDTMIEGDSGLAECAERRHVRFKYEPTKRRFTFPDLRTTGTTFSAEEPESLRGPQHHTVWGDEWASWSYKVDPQGATAWSNAQFGLRLDPDPRALLTSTPKPIPVVKTLVADARTEGSGVVMTQGSLRDNIANLAPSYVRQILAKYGGTTLGAQEIDGLLIDRVEGALWQPELIDQYRLLRNDLMPQLDQIVIGVDPPAEQVAECGIIIMGREAKATDPLRRHVYVLEDVSLRGTADEWGRAVIAAYHRWNANMVVGEVNNGGDMVRAVVQLQDPAVSFTKVRATEGKRLRAEPVQAVYQQGRAHHVGYFGALESEMCVVAGTMVATPSGDVPVENVIRGDRVMTRDGWRRVRWAGRTGYKATLAITTEDGHEIECTPEHPLWVFGVGWVPAREVETGHRLATWDDPGPNQQPSSMGASTPSRREMATTGQRPAPHPTSSFASYIGMSTSTTTDRSLLASTSTTRTTFVPTTMRAIWRRCRRLLTSWSMGLRGVTRGRQPNERLPGRPNGPHAGRARSYARAVEQRTNPPVNEPSTARFGATTVVARSAPTGAAQPVYDISVEGTHEFVAGGLLVHNTTWTGEKGEPSPDHMDAMVWGATHLLPGLGMTPARSASPADRRIEGSRATASRGR